MKVNPEYVKIGDKKYKINTSYRVAIKCNEIVMDESISDYERSLAIIYLLYGDEGLKDRDNYQKLMELALKYISCGEKVERDDEREEPDMDFQQDFNLIRASFKSDYGIDIMKEDLHWWDFYTYLNGLSEGCILNRIRELRTYDTSEMTDLKEKKKIEKAKRRFRLRGKQVKLSDKQKESAERFYKLTGIKRKE